MTQAIAATVRWTLPTRALVRTSCLAPARPDAASESYARAGEELVAALTELTRRTARAEQVLYDLAGRADPVLRAVLLPARREALRERRPSAALAASLGGLSDEIDSWLAAHAEVDRLTTALVERRPAALADSRRRLAAWCSDEGFARAAALTGTELLRAVRRCAERRGVTDRRGVKSEPTVLRHATRAATKTTPLTWFARVGWLDWTPGARPLDGTTTATVHPDLAGLGRAIAAAVEGLDPAARPVRLAPGSWVLDGRLTFRRPDGSGDARPARAELVSLPVTSSLRALLDVLAAAPSGTATPAWLADAMAPAAGPAARAALVGRLAQLQAAGLLVTDADVVDPQSTTPLDDAVRWAMAVGRVDLADALTEVDRLTGGWPTTAADDRPALLAGLAAAWSRVPGATAYDEPARPPVSEDVTVSGVGTVAPCIDTDAITRLAPLFELFDWFTVLRRVHRQQFVERYGVGGSCASVAAHAVDYNRLWTDPAALAGPWVATDPTATAVLDLRTALAAAVVNHGDEVVLDDDLIDTAARGLPEVTQRRPSSFSVFAQQSADGALCINQVYGGWGRFTSRFLRGLTDRASAAVRDTIADTLGPGSRAAQVRPVEDFAANLHPLLVEDEIADRVDRGSLGFDRVEVVHDQLTDQVRFRERGTDRLLDVLYLGFLVPLALPPHLTPLTNDLGSGLVDLTPLRPVRQVGTRHGRVTVVPRLRHRSVVISRRAWVFPPTTVTGWVAALTDPGAVPERVVAGLRADTGMPRHVFVGAGTADAADGDGPGSTAVDGLVRRMGQLRSQYVDLLDAGHVHHLARLLARFGGAVRIEAAEPGPTAGEPARELVLETYRKALTP